MMIHEDPNWAEHADTVREIRVSKNRVTFIYRKKLKIGLPSPMVLSIRKDSNSRTEISSLYRRMSDIHNVSAFLQQTLKSNAYTPTNNLIPIVPLYENKRLRTHFCRTL
jgi:hypothetical protein